MAELVIVPKPGTRSGPERKAGILIRRTKYDRRSLGNVKLPSTLLGSVMLMAQLSASVKGETAACLLKDWSKCTLTAAPDDRPLP